MIWTTSQGWGGQTHVMLLGKIPVAEVSYDPMTGKGDANKYLLSVFLPGLAKKNQHYPDAETAKKTAVDIVNLWIHKAGLAVAPAEQKDEPA